MSSIDAVIFDLGNVLVDVDESRTVRHWAACCGADDDAVAEIRRVETDYHRLERGEIDLAGYYRIMVERLPAPITFEQFAAGWNCVFGDVLPGMKDLVATLATNVRVAALSNTSAAHVEIWSPLYADILSHFERVFVSNEMGARKPEPACYRQVLEYLSLPAERVAFFDDRVENVRAACALGVQGRLAVDAEQMTEELRRLGAAV